MISENEHLIGDSNEIRVYFEKDLSELVITSKDDAILNIITKDNALILWQLLTGIEVYKSNDELFDEMEKTKSGQPDE